MNPDLPAQLCVVWWNTSLAPLGRNRAGDADQEFVLNYLAWLNEKDRIDLLALGEVSIDQIELIREKLSREEFEVHIGRVDVGRLKFDTGVVYRKSVFSILEEQTLIASYADSQVKIGEHLRLACMKNDAVFDFVVCHWSSRLWVPEFSVLRDVMGVRLRAYFEKWNAESRNFFLSVGDFNDEPFSTSLSGHLLATQDRSLAIASKHYLYNPFWRHMGDSNPVFMGSATGRRCGTYFRPAQNMSRWKVFDQMLFSREFLVPSALMLNEQSVKIIDEDEVMERVMSDSFFDHLPIIAKIDIGENNG